MTLSSSELKFLQICRTTLHKWKLESQSSGILEYKLLGDIEVISAEEDGAIVMKYPEIKPEHLNLMGRAHGGMLATWVDIATSFVVWATTETNYVSVHIDISYVNAAKEGDCLILESRADKIGRTLGFVRCKITNQDGKVIATACHTLARSKL